MKNYAMLNKNIESKDAHTSIYGGFCVLISLAVSTTIESSRSYCWMVEGDHLRAARSKWNQITPRVFGDFVSAIFGSLVLFVAVKCLNIACCYYFRLNMRCNATFSIQCWRLISFFFVSVHVYTCMTAARKYTTNARTVFCNFHWWFCMCVFEPFM